MSQIIGGHTFVPLEKNIDDVKLNSITGGATITSELISTQTQTTSTGTGDYFLLLQAAGNLAKILTTDLATSLGSSSGMIGAITSVRLRSYNSVGNPGFEVDQRSCFAARNPLPGGSWIQDRWLLTNSGAMTANYASNAGGIVIPGTSYFITQRSLLLSVATAAPSLGAGDYWAISTSIEGPVYRELAGDVTSISVLVYTSVAGLKFGIYLKSSDAGVTLVKLCTVPNANTWTLITLPNIPKPTSGNFPLAAGGIAYQLGIALACGTTYTAPAADTWQSGNFIGAPGMSNFFATAGNSIYIAFIQHEPGPLCTTLQDKPFSVAYDECLRYYCKAPMAYGTKFSDGSWVQGGSVVGGTTAVRCNIMFPKRMAKVPGVIVSGNNSTINQIYIEANAANVLVAGGGIGAGETGIGNITLNSNAAGTGLTNALIGYQADTGW